VVLAAPAPACRCLRLSLYGLLLDGPIGHAWYRLLDSTVHPEAPISHRAVLLKTAADQLLWAPAMTVVFFAFIKALELHPELILPTIQVRPGGAPLRPLLSQCWAWGAQRSVRASSGPLFLQAFGALCLHAVAVLNSPALPGGWRCSCLASLDSQPPSTVDGCCMRRTSFGRRWRLAIWCGRWRTTSISDLFLLSIGSCTTTLCRWVPSPRPCITTLCCGLACLQVGSNEASQLYACLPACTGAGTPA
jgi:hypothetical protein